MNPLVTRDIKVLVDTYSLLTIWLCHVSVMNNQAYMYYSTMSMSTPNKGMAQ